MEQKKTITKDDHADAKALNQLTNILRNLPKQSILDMSPKLRTIRGNNDSDSSPGRTPVKSKAPKRKSMSKHVQYQKIDDYLRSRDCLPQNKEIQERTKKKLDSVNSKPPVAATRSKENLNTNGSKKRKIQKRTDSSPIKQSNIDSFFNKPSYSKSKKTEKKPKSDSSFKRSESSDSCELPTFKTSKKSAGKKKQKSSFKKYGISTPSIEEILKDKKDLEKHKNQMEAFQLQPWCNTSFELPFSTKDLDNPSEINENVLDCKNLTLNDITKMFKGNLNHLSNVINGKVYNERHERYHDKNNKLFTLTPRDLSFSTSMIVFTFEQKEHMLSLLNNEFDPTNEKTHYFFQVLLPELCLRIFMEAHQMSLEEAVNYLEERPPIMD